MSSRSRRARRFKRCVSHQLLRALTPEFLFDVLTEPPANDDFHPDDAA